MEGIRLGAAEAEGAAVVGVAVGAFVGDAVGAFVSARAIVGSARAFVGGTDGALMGASFVLSDVCTVRL